MKIVIFQGGLGNQLFEYSFYCYLKKHVENNVRCLFNGAGHNGMEIEKWFQTDLKHVSTIRKIEFKVKDYLYHHGYIKCPWVTEHQTFELEKANIFYDYWQNKKYLQKDYISYRDDLPMSKENLSVLCQMANTNSIALHVRRGDYLLPQFSSIYGGICTEFYYRKAIEICKGKIDKPQFFVFSDDIEWVKNNMEVGDAVFIDWNKGENSFYDMYLMSHCKANIIANSSFSFWGANLNQNSLFTIYPSKWYNSTFPVPDIFPDTWIGIK